MPAAADKSVADANAGKSGDKIAAKNAAIEARLAAVTRYLSSDELEGRGLGTKGLDLAADYIADHLRQLDRYGVRTDAFHGGPFQKFKVGIDTALGSTNRLTLVGPASGKDKKPLRIELEVGNDFTPLAISGNGRFDLPLVFAGYGITARKAGYDDFAGIDVANKAVVMLRHQPRDEANDKESAAIKATTSTHSSATRWPMPSSTARPRSSCAATRRRCAAAATRTTRCSRSTSPARRSATRTCRCSPAAAR